MPRLLFIASLLLSLLVVAPRASAQDIAPSHRQAAEDLLVASNTEAMMVRARDEILTAQIQQDPSMAPFEGVMREFLAQHLSWKALKGDLVQLYATTFTEDELRDISAFYRTPTGQKAIATMPDLMAQGMQLGQRRVEKNLPELERRIEERIKELSTQQ